MISIQWIDLQLLADDTASAIKTETLHHSYEIVLDKWLEAFAERFFEKYPKESVVSMAVTIFDGRSIRSFQRYLLTAVGS